MVVDTSSRKSSKVLNLNPNDRHPLPLLLEVWTKPQFGIVLEQTYPYVGALELKRNEI